MRRFIEICSASEAQILVGCTINSVHAENEDEDAGFCIECCDKDGKEVSVSISDDGLWSLYAERDAKCEVCANPDVGGAALYCNNCGAKL